MKEKKKKNQKHKFFQKGHGNEPTVIEFNLSKAVIILIVIGVIIATITTVKVITSIMRAQENKVLAGEETNEHVVWVESTDVDEEGNPVKVPVPKGYSASKIPGETSANNGFVIYEGDVDWDAILVDTASQNSMSTQATEEEETNVEKEPSNIETTTQDKENTANTITSNDSIEGANTNNTMIKDENQETLIEDTISQTNTTNSKEQENNQNTTNNTTENKNQFKENTEVPQVNLEDEKITDTEQTIEENKNTVENSNNEENSTEQEIKDNQETSNNQEGDNQNQQPEVNTQALTNETTTTESTNTTNEETVEPRAVSQQDINIFNLQKERNQYVWVPVKDPSRIYGVDSNGKLWGKLYTYSSTRRTASNWTETNGIMRISSRTGYREPDITHYNTDGDIDSRLQSFMNGKTEQELLTKELEEYFYVTIKSIKEYGGFYIGRYETGGLNGTAVVRKMDTNIYSQTWYTMYEKTNGLSGTNENVMTSMIWGSLWDETLQWLVESGATITSTGEIMTYSLLINSNSWGNYKDSTFYYIPSGSEVPDATSEKSSRTRIPAGSSEYTKVNNIYDLAGNVYDWTLEANSADLRVLRGGDFYSNGSSRPATYRDTDPPSSRNGYGSRALLLIK